LLKANTLPQTELVAFLLQAKRSTYAAGGSDSQAVVRASLPDSHQLEYRSGDLLYRDIYFGEAYFVGQETVYQGDHAIYAMCYAGGWVQPMPKPAEISRLGGFLQDALKQIPEDYPFRGPLEYRQEEVIYRNEPNGDLSRFWGVEQIYIEDLLVYKLHYCGGLLEPQSISLDS
jgi:hypothetical protein